MSFAGNGGQCCGGIFNSLSLTCFSWGEAGGERGAWFVSMSSRAGRENSRVTRKKEEKKARKNNRTHRSKSRRKKKKSYSAEPSLANKSGASEPTERNGRASRGAMKLSQVGAGSGRERADPQCVITQGARARPISARGSPAAGQSARASQAATA